MKRTIGNKRAKEYGVDYTHLHLSPIANKIWYEVEDMRIYEIEDDSYWDSYKYFVRGAIEGDNLSESELNDELEYLWYTHRFR